MSRQYADEKDFLPGRPAQAKASCPSGTITDRIAKRLMFLPPQACRVEARRAKTGRGGKGSASVCRGVALAKTGLRMSSERSERAANRNSYMNVQKYKFEIRTSNFENHCP